MRVHRRGRVAVDTVLSCLGHSLLLAEGSEVASSAVEDSFEKVVQVARIDTVYGSFSRSDAFKALVVRHSVSDGSHPSGAISNVFIILGHSLIYFWKAHLGHSSG